VFAAAEMQVAKLNTTSNVETILVLNTDYTVTLNGDQNGTPGGTITLPAVLASGYNLTITSDIANLQPTDLTNQGGFFPEVITDALDRATIQIQQLDQNSRAIKIPLSDGVLDMTTPVVSARQGKYLAFDSLGLPVASVGTGNDSALRTDLANATAVSAGSRLSGFRQTGTGATARTVDAKLKDTVHVKDFGAVCDGVTNDTAALNAAILFCQYNHKILHISGIVRIFSTINITEQLHIEFDCHQDTGSTIPDFSNGSFILKDPSVNGWGIVITAYGFSATGGGVRGVAGSDLGGGIWIKGPHTKWKKPSVFDVGGIGIRLGADANPPYNPSNNCLLESPIISSNGSHGLYIYSITNDANQGTITNAQIIGNGGCGIKCEGGRNIFIGANVEANDSYGLYLTGTATGNTFLNGDIETNDNPGTFLDIKIDDSSLYNNFLGFGYTNRANFYYTSLSKTMIIDGSYGEIVTPVLISERIIPSGAVGPEKLLNVSFGTPTIFPVGSVNARLDIIAGATTTVFTMPSTTNLGSSALVHISTINNFGRTVVALVVAIHGTATVVATNLYRTNADFDIVISGLNVQLRNTAVVPVQANTTAILF
jgi:hypothetical protein